MSNCSSPELYEGFGMWETVSVRVVDDVQEAKVAAAREHEVRECI